MIETSSQKKIKINLKDYDYETDIQNRLLLADFSHKDLEVLEEILYSPLKCAVSDLASALEMPLQAVEQHLEKIAQTGLFERKDSHLVINKERRKYFETQIVKFDEDFTPGMEFLQSLLKKVPIHVLPNWYPISRTTNNIFDSLVEKYLSTPQAFQRYLNELNLGDDILQNIVHDVFQAPNYKLFSKDVMHKYGLDQGQFEEAMLHLEFNFVCCLVYERQGDEWREVITLFHEWKQYLRFVRESQPQSISSETQVAPFRGGLFCFSDDLIALLRHIHNAPLTLRLSPDEEWVVEPAHEDELRKVLALDKEASEYINRLTDKLRFLKLVYIESSTLIPQPHAQEWLNLPRENQALAIYKHTLQNHPYSEYPEELPTERNIREIEKSISRIIDKEWVYLDDFLGSVLAQISENSKIVLTKKGRHWHYSHPKYTETEIQLITHITYHWMFEGGIVEQGMHGEKRCLRVTPFGKKLFG